MSSPNGLFSGSHAPLAAGLWKTASGDWWALDDSIGGLVGSGGRRRGIGGLWKTAAGEFRGALEGVHLQLPVASSIYRTYDT